MSKAAIFVAAVALIAMAVALPVFEENDWDETDELLTKIYSESTPMALMQADPATIAHAKAAKEAAAASETKAAAEENKWAADEAKYVNQTKALNKAARDLARNAAIKNAADKKKLAEDAEKTTAKIAETMKGTSAAEEEYEKVQAEMKKIQDDMATESGAAKKAEAEKLAAYKGEMDKLHKELAGETNEGKKIAKDQIKQAKKLAADQKAITENYDSEMKTLDDQHKLEKKKLSEEEAKAQAGFSKKFADNAARAAAQKAALAAEKSKNDADAAAAKAAIEKRGADEQAAKAAAKQIYDKKTAAEAAALAATRESIHKKFQKTADAAEAKYEYAMANAAALKQKADHAQATYNAAVKSSAEHQAAVDKAEAAQNDHDAEMSECALDGSECLGKDGTCKKVTDKGPYMGEDLVSCSDTKPAEQHYAGLAWAGIPPPPPIEPIPAPSAACKAAREAFAKLPVYGKSIEDGVCPTIGLACVDVAEDKLSEKKKAMLQYFDMAAECPPWCLPGSETFDSNGVKTTNGICIRAEDTLMYKQQISDLPEWKAMGTNFKIPANAGIVDMCTMAKNFLKGFEAAVAEPPKKKA